MFFTRYGTDERGRAIFSMRALESLLHERFWRIIRPVIHELSLFQLFVREHQTLIAPSGSPLQLATV
jgi:hypothetical protein